MSTEPGELRQLTSAEATEGADEHGLGEVVNSICSVKQLLKIAGTLLMNGVVP